MSKRICLIRHGEIDYGNERRYIGITDFPLCDRGVQQIQRLKLDLEVKNLEKIYCSPLRRCRQTAEIIRAGWNIPLEIVKDLEEIHMGSWENKTMASVKIDFPLLYKERGQNMASFTPPMGESFEQLQRRVFPAFERIVTNTAESSMIVAHAGVNRVILAKLHGLPLDKIFEIEQGYGFVNVLEFVENDFVT